MGDHYGIRWIENYSLNTRPPSGAPPAGVEALLPEVADLMPDQHPFGSPYVHRFTTMLIEPPVYLAAVLQDFHIAGGKVVVQEFANASEIIALPEPVVMNCTGLGAGTLFSDKELTPVKGQLIFLLPQPEIDYITIGGALYMFPRRDGILLGGTHEPGVSTLEPNPEGISARVERATSKYFRRCTHRDRKSSHFAPGGAPCRRPDRRGGKCPCGRIGTALLEPLLCRHSDSAAKDFLQGTDADLPGPNPRAK